MNRRVTTLHMPIGTERGEPRPQQNRRTRPHRRVRVARIDAERAFLYRIRGVAVFFSLLLGVILVRAYDVQVNDGARYQEVADRQALASTRVSAKRGVIKDRHRAELALTVDVDSVYAQPRKIPDPKNTAQALAPVLRLDAKKLERRLKSQRPFVYLGRKVGSKTADAVRALALPGVGVEAEPRRFYPNRTLLAHVLGFVDHDGAGQAGAERHFDGILRGKSYEVAGLRDALGNRAFVDGLVPHAALEGNDLVLTIDRHIQFAAERVLERTLLENDAQAGVVVVTRPKTGEVLALASLPTFNPNNLKGTGAREHMNRAISAVYEPGSTIKMVTIAAALEEGVITSDETIDCENGRWTVGGRSIGDAQHRYGVLSIGEILKHSSNICAAKIGLRLGPERLHAWLARFGFGRATGVELPGELSGLLREGRDWRPIETANVAFGQGLSATAMQIAQAASVIANDGIWIDPHIVLERSDATGNTVKYVPVRDPVRTLSRETARRVKSMMGEVTEAGGTAETAAIPGFRVAGKTGTAQKIDPVTKAYSRSLYVASFVGFVPLENPEVLVLVLVDEPRRQIYGGQIAAPAFREIASAALSALSLVPEDPSRREAFLASFRPVDVPPAATALDDGTTPMARHILSASSSSASGDDDVGAQPTDWEPDPFLRTEVAATDADDSADKVASGSEQKMPDFAGLGLHKVLSRSREVHCDLVLKGTGRVVRQNPLAGTTLKFGQRCELELRPSG